MGSLPLVMDYHEVMKEELNNEYYGYSVKRHLNQNASMLGYMKSKGYLNNENQLTFMEFGAGRGKIQFSKLISLLNTIYFE